MVHIFQCVSVWRGGTVSVATSVDYRLSGRLGSSCSLSATWVGDSDWLFDGLSGECGQEEGGALITLCDLWTGLQPSKVLISAKVKSNAVRLVPAWVPRRLFMINTHT